MKKRDFPIESPALLLQRYNILSPKANCVKTHSRILKATNSLTKTSPYPLFFRTDTLPYIAIKTKDNNGKPMIIIRKSFPVNSFYTIFVLKFHSPHSENTTSFPTNSQQTTKLQTLIADIIHTCLHPKNNHS